MQDKQINISRRNFLTGSLAGVAMASLPQWFVKEANAANMAQATASPRRIGPNDTINIAVIGPGGSKGGYQMGRNITRHAASKPGVKVVAACDVDEVHLREAVEMFGPDCKGYRDFRELLADKSIDAVFIGTPDHWHAYQCIAAMKAGKDVYCEKPLTLSIYEGKKIVKAWRETGAVFQTGSQQRSEGNFRLACELVRNGRIGQLQNVEARLPGGPVGGPFQTHWAPRDLDWNMWLGPAPWAPYVKERTHGTFRWWLEYSGGMLTDWGAHHNDIAQWGIGMDRSGPISVQAFGRGPVIGENCYNTFPEFNVYYEYANGIPLRTTNQGENGVLFTGDEGWIFVSRGKLEASDQRLIDEPLPDNAQRLYQSNDHAGNFLDCVRSRDRQPICDAEIGHRSVTVCHLANISLRLGGRKLQWDPAKEEFVRDPEANALLESPTRDPWRV